MLLGGVFHSEAGCGNGAQWEENIQKLPSGCKLILSDFSYGMVEIVKNKYADDSNITAQQIDIQCIDYPDESFDVVIANHMLYHVPDLSKALSEVSRVLKPNGTFYAATNGNGGLRAFLEDELQRADPDADGIFRKNGASVFRTGVNN
ncbi:MAG: class I SAM-dependent methyltransferase [Oscillospiraceae bacterium]